MDLEAGDKVEDRRENGMKGRLAQWLRRLGAQGAALICVALALCCFAAEKEGYHMDELLSFQLSNAQFNPWIVPTQPVGRLAKFVQEEIRGESFGETVGNLADTVRDVVENRGASRLLQYRADVYPEPVWIGAEQFHDYITVGEEDAFSYLSVYFNVKDDNHPPLHFMLLHTMSSLFRDTVGPFQGCAINILAILGCCVCFFGLGALLERQGIPYRIPNRELAFFNHRIVQDIRNIISFAENPGDTDLFLQIYYKISTYISRQDALCICGIAREKNMAVLEAAIGSGQLPYQTVNACKGIAAQLKRLLLERADLAVNRILQNMGYGDYLERMEISSSKLFVLRAIARKEPSPVLFVKRLEELQKIMKEKKDKEECLFTLSTIHASKGLEYDSVYLLDIVDGIFPERVPGNPGAMKQEEADAYEEERRLFYVAVTRAKNKLFLFQWNQKTTFCQELWEEEEKAAFGRFCSAIGQGLVVEHTKLGEGVVVEVGEEKIVIQFGDRRRQFCLKSLFEHGLLKF